MPEWTSETSPICGSSSLPFASILDTLSRMLAKVYSCAVIGLDGAVVEVEVDTANGPPRSWKSNVLRLRVTLLLL